MELQLILQRLKETIDKMETLNDNHFDYLLTISQFDYQQKRGIVCSVFGFYPIWFPDKFSYYLEHPDIPVHQIDIDYQEDGILYTHWAGLSKYHGLSDSFLDALFDGERLWNEEGKLFENEIDNSLDGVIQVFKKVYELLETGVISPDYDDYEYKGEFVLPF